MRLVAQKIGPTFGDHEMLGYSLAGDRVPAKSKPSGPGPTIFVTRGEPTEITVVNQLAEPTAVHWHGIELESYFDGVAGWSGAGARVAPLIAPKDSFVARFTAPRAGTFIYHTHANDADQLMTGLYGALVVLEPGQSWNDTTDHVFLVGDAPDWTVVNGSPSPTPMKLKADVPHRLRFVSMMIDGETDVTISRADSVASWKPLAKDAIPLRAKQSAPARLHFGPGETYDFEFTPTPGEYEMKVSAYTKVLLTIVAR
jgi:FtsP/CotA-like multicopper oxidase with cupredoxin domain